MSGQFHYGKTTRSGITLRNDRRLAKCHIYETRVFWH